MLHVTDVIDNLPERDLIAWKLRVGLKEAQRVSQEALRVGDLVDRAIQVDLGFRQEPLTLTHPAVMTCLQNWQRFKERHLALVTAVVATQEELCDGEVVGHPDLTIDREGGGGFISLKTSRMTQHTHWAQEGGYLWLKRRLSPAHFAMRSSLPKTLSLSFLKSPSQ